jgi:hypothetical protein
MPIICTGCGQSFKLTGVKNHTRQSTNPRCKSAVFIKACQGHTTPGPPIEDHASGGHEEDSEFPTDPSGDRFGDYRATALEEDECQSEFSDHASDSDIDASSRAPESSDSDDSEDDGFDEEDRLEAPREPIPSFTTPHSHLASPQAGSDASQQTWTQESRRRGGTEESLTKKPFVVPYPTAFGAGMVRTNSDTWTNEAYGRQVKTADIQEIYAPFASELEWEFARWAKLRGPSSTAVTELLGIKGVSIFPACTQTHLGYHAHIAFGIRNFLIAQGKTWSHIYVSEATEQDDRPFAPRTTSFSAS